MNRLKLIVVLWLYVTAAAGAAEPVLNWTRVTAAATWQPRDSQGEAVFKDQLWILGGWFDSYHAPPRDVWASSDGQSWRKVSGEAPWKRSRSRSGKERWAIVAGEMGGDGSGEVIEHRAVLLAAGFDDGQHAGDEATAPRALRSKR